MEFLNTVTGQIETYDDAALTPAAMQTLASRGLRQASEGDVRAREEHLFYATTAQQALAQAERVVRGATLGQVEGLTGTNEEIRQRAEVSQEESPVLSFAADALPDVGLALATGGTSALATGAGRLAAKQAIKGGVRSALGAAAKAAPRAALAGEAAAGGAVAASQEAFQEGRQFLRDDPIEDAYNTLFWAGLGGAIGAAPAAVRALRGGRKGAKELASEAELQVAREAGERTRAAETMAPEPAALPETGGARTRGEPTTSDPAVQEQFARAGEEIPPPSMAPGPATGAPEPPSGVRPTEPGAAPPIEQASPLDAYLGSFDGAERDAIADEIEDQVFERFDELGKKAPQPGTRRWQAVEDEIVNARIEAAGGKFEPVPAPARETTLESAGRAPNQPEITPGSADRAAEAAADTGVSRAERNAMRSQAEDVVERVARGESPIKEGGGWQRDSRLARYRKEIVETATKEARNDLNELNRLSQGIRERAIKQADVAKNIGDNLAAQQAAARDIALEGQKLAGSIRADAAALGAQLGGKKPNYFSGTARDLVTSLLERTKRISEATTGAQAFIELDDLKRITDNTKVALEQGSRTSAKDPLRYQELIPRVEEFANKIRAQLESVEAFGRAGEMQKAYNATYHQKWFPAKQVFEDSVFRVTGRDYKAFSTMDAWESKITSLLETAGGGERRHVVDMLDALKEMAQQRATYGTAPKAETDRIVALVDKIHRTFGLADETTAAARRMENLGTVAGTAAAGLGAVFGGLPGAILGGGLAKGAQELATGRFRNAFSNLREATASTVERSVDDWIAVSRSRGGSKAAGPARKLKLSAEDSALLEVAKRRGTTIAFAQFLGEDDNPQSAFVRKRDALMDDEKFARAFSDEFGEMATEHPQAYMIAAGKAAEVRAFLLDRVPTSIAISMRNPRGYPPTNESIEDWSVYYNAATDPRSVLRSLSRGDIRPQEIETLRTLYPQRYEQLQASILGKIDAATQSGQELDDQFLMRMNLLFDLDGAGSPAFSQRAANVARNWVPPEAQAAQSQKPFAPKLGSRVSPSNVAVTGPTYGTLN